MDHKIAQAQGLLARRYHEPLSVGRLARELNVSYSSFRQAFKAQTGISPKQYLPPDPLTAFRESGYEMRVASERKSRRAELGITASGSYA